MASTNDPLSKFYRRLRRSGEDVLERSDLEDTGRPTPFPYGTAVELLDDSGYHDYGVVIAYPRVIDTFLGLKVGVAYPSISKTHYALEDLWRFEHAPVREFPRRQMAPESVAKREGERVMRAVAKSEKEYEMNPRSGKKKKAKKKRRNPTRWNEEWTPIATIGDSDPVAHMGGIIYETPYGIEMLYFQETEGTVYVHRLDIEGDVLADVTWADLPAVASWVGEGEDVLRAASRGNLHARAQLYEAIAGYHGWSNFDDDPEVLTLAQAEDKYGPDADAAYVHQNRNRNPSCGSGKLLVKRKGYTRHDGVKVAPTSFCIVDRGKKGRGKDIVPDLREGKLGGPGYTDKPAAKRRKILTRCVKQYGYRSCLGSLQYLLLVGEREWPKSKLKKVAADKAWLKKGYGGPGSFGPEDNPRRRQLANRLSNP